MKISQIQNIPNPKTQSPNEFEEKTTKFLNEELPRFINETNDVASDLTGKWSNVNYWTGLTENYKNTTQIYMNNALNYKNSAYAYKTEAINAANSIKSYAIPEEATYKKDEIDVMLNGLLTHLVALQAQVAILTK